tara:strand:+ start:1654 stop:2607 length:954 start_codon:yes stop_codon:yes gene_type:complete
MNNKEVKILFMGTAEFGIPTLKVLNDNYNLDAIITNYDKPSGRGLKIKFSPVKKFAISNNIKYFQPKNLKDQSFIDKIKSINPDIIVVVAFRMIPKSIWQIPKYGTINLHASLLPNYRGSAPINWTIINNENFTGVTTFFIDDKIDTGDILLQEKIKVDKKINAGELHDKLKVIGAITVKKTIKEILNNTLIKKKQKQDGDYKTAYKLDKENIKIDWTKNCLEIHNKIRGLSPFPGARTSLINNKGDIKRAIFYESEYIVQNHNFENGQIIKEKDSFKITCNDGYLLIKNLKIEGKKRMNTSSFLNGFNIENYKMVK